MLAKYISAQCSAGSTGVNNKQMLRECKFMQLNIIEKSCLLVFLYIIVVSNVHADDTCPEGSNDCYNGEYYWDWKNASSGNGVAINFTNENIIATRSVATKANGDPVFPDTSYLDIHVHTTPIEADGGILNDGNGSHYLDEVLIEARASGGDWTAVKRVDSDLRCDFSIGVAIGSTTERGSCFANPVSGSTIYSYQIVESGEGRTNNAIHLSQSEIQTVSSLIGEGNNGIFPPIEWRVTVKNNDSDVSDLTATRTIRVGDLSEGNADFTNQLDRLIGHGNTKHDDYFVEFNAPSDSDTERTVTGYMGDWAVYGRRLNGAGLNFDNYDWVVHSFLGICSESARTEVSGGLDGEPEDRLGPEFEYAKNFYDQCNADGITDGTMRLNDPYAWGDGTGANSKTLTAPNGDTVQGLSGLYSWYKDNGKPVNFGISVGGWTLSHAFKYLSNETQRQTFLTSLETFLRENRFITGVDVDWEWQRDETEGALFITLMQEVRAKLDTLETEFGVDYRLSTAVFSTASIISNIDMEALNSVADAVYIMSYDFSGPWGQNVGFHTNTFPEDTVPAPSSGDLLADEEHSVAGAVQRFLNLGIAPEKLYLGIAQYGRAMQMCSGDGDITSASPLTGDSCYTTYNDRLSVGTKERGVVEYWSFHEMYDPGNPGLEVSYDSVVLGGQTFSDVPTVNGFSYFSDHTRNADYWVNPSKGIFFDMETPRTVCNKARVIEKFNLGGALSWAIEYDNHKLINAFKYCLGYEPADDEDGSIAAALTAEVGAYGASLAEAGFDWSDIESQFAELGPLPGVILTKPAGSQSSYVQHTTGWHGPAKWSPATFYVVRDSAIGPTKPQWAGDGFTMLTVPVVHEDGSDDVIYLRAIRKLHGSSTQRKMNTGVYTNRGSRSRLELRYIELYNLHLDKGARYMTTHEAPLLIDVWPWSDWRMNGVPQETLTFSLDITVGGGDETVFTPDSTVDSTGLVEGLQAEYFASTFWSNIQAFPERLPNLNRVESVLNHPFTSSNWVGVDFQQNFAAQFNGYILVPESGRYVFLLNSNDGSRMTLSDQVIVNNDGIHGMREVSSSILTLEAGEYYPISIEYFQGGGGAGLQLKYRGPDKLHPTIISSSMLRTEPILSCPVETEGEE